MSPRVPHRPSFAPHLPPCAPRHVSYTDGIFRSSNVRHTVWFSRGAPSSYGPMEYCGRARGPGAICGTRYYDCAKAIVYSTTETFLHLCRLLGTFLCVWGGLP